MADNKKNILEAAPPAEAPAPTAENAAVPEQPAPEPVLTDAEAVMLEHEGQAALFEMGEAVPDAADRHGTAHHEHPPEKSRQRPQPQFLRDRLVRLGQDPLLAHAPAPASPFFLCGGRPQGRCAGAGRGLSPAPRLSDQGVQQHRFFQVHRGKENDRELPDPVRGGVSGLSAAYRFQY